MYIVVIVLRVPEVKITPLQNTIRSGGTTSGGGATSSCYGATSGSSDANNVGSATSDNGGATSGGGSALSGYTQCNDLTYHVLTYVSYFSTLVQYDCECVRGRWLLIAASSTVSILMFVVINICIVE